MVKITIDVPEDLERKAKILKVELSFLAAKALKERINELEEIAEFERIVSKSNATEKDVEELTGEVNAAMLEHHKKKHKL